MPPAGPSNPVNLQEIYCSLEMSLSSTSLAPYRTRKQHPICARLHLSSSPNQNSCSSEHWISGSRHKSRDPLLTVPLLNPSSLPPRRSENERIYRPEVQMLPWQGRPTTAWARNLGMFQSFVGPTLIALNTNPFKKSDRPTYYLPASSVFSPPRDFQEHSSSP